MTPSEVLSRAADLIRDTAAGSVPGKWFVDGLWVESDAPHAPSVCRLEGDNGRWIALLSPAVAPLLADWLETEASCLAAGDDVQRTVPALIDSLDGPDSPETTISVTIDTSGPALAFARYVIRALGGEDE